jgi:protocatechuate 3,4-dioxygenase beta subunit
MEGQVRDTDGAPIAGAVVDVWHRSLDGAGRPALEPRLLLLLVHHQIEEMLHAETGNPEEGEVIFMEGQVRDTDGAPIAGAVVDVWHANTRVEPSGGQPYPEGMIDRNR